MSGGDICIYINTILAKITSQLVEEAMIDMRFWNVLYIQNGIHKMLQVLSVFYIYTEIIVTTLYMYIYIFFFF